VKKKTDATVITYATLLGRIYESEMTKQVGVYDTSGFEVLILEELMQIPPKDYLDVFSATGTRSRTRRAPFRTHMLLGSSSMSARCPTCLATSST
jgi:hypothetical protein